MDQLNAEAGWRGYVPVLVLVTIYPVVLTFRLLQNMKHVECHIYITYQLTLERGAVCLNNMHPVTNHSFHLPCNHSLAIS
jgi:hypothetical protein